MPSISKLLDKLILENSNSSPDNFIDWFDNEINYLGRENLENVDAYQYINKLCYEYSELLKSCSNGILTINALACNDKIIVPVQDHFLAAKGMVHLLKAELTSRGKSIFKMEKFRRNKEINYHNIYINI